MGADGWQWLCIGLLAVWIVAAYYVGKVRSRKDTVIFLKEYDNRVQMRTRAGLDEARQQAVRRRQDRIAARDFRPRDEDDA